MLSKEMNYSKGEIEALAEGLASTFIQRRDLYARQLDDGRFICIQRPLKPSHLILHLKGELTLGAYVLDTHSRARYIVFDADDEPSFDKLIGMAVSLSNQGATVYLEKSRRAGHAWLFFSQAIPGREARDFGRGLMAFYNLDGIELFPKQAQLSTGPGSLIRLPFGIHRRDGQRYEIIKPDGEPVDPLFDEQIAYLCTPQTIPTALFEAIRSNDPNQNTRTDFDGSRPQTRFLSEQIKASVSVRDFISQYVKLSPEGVGLCPFHDDQKASFAVNPQVNYWHCFAGCGGGSIIDFWMKWQGCDFKTALRELAGMLL